VYTSNEPDREPEGSYLGLWPNRGRLETWARGTRLPSALVIRPPRHIGRVARHHIPVCQEFRTAAAMTLDVQRRGWREPAIATAELPVPSPPDAPATASPRRRASP